MPGVGKVYFLFVGVAEEWRVEFDFSPWAQLYDNNAPEKYDVI